ncbi:MULTISPECIES: S24 family peptidase [unclassified Acinetobacter]|uniref:S24 family peptidase n=1 Tax=unclassified Acinetobacter TaxID=196816 RepID=UPI001C552C48|nr:MULTISPECIES: S24 family peptidase [unclassified Acinetobacter]
MIETVADRIDKRMKELKIKQVDLINKKVASKGTISLWLSGGAVPSGERLVKLSNELKVDAAWILTGQGSINDRLDNNVDLNPLATVIYAPVISWVQAGDFTDMESISNLAECEKLPLVPGAGRRSFYLEVKGLSNAPYFEEGEKICIDPDYQLEDIQTGEMVVVKCNDTATFKALISESNGYFLKPLNPNWNEQVIPLNEDCMLVGKYVGSFKPAKKFNLF